MKRVITYGTFDLLHYGHINLLKRAKELGGYLIVGITSDSYDVSRGKLNVSQSLMQRIENIRKTQLADEIIIEDYEGQKIEDIKKYHIDVFAIGSDWKDKFDYLNDYCKVIYLERTKNISSTQIRCNGNIMKVGIVGSGRIAQRFVQESKFVSGIEVFGVCSRSLDSAKKFAGEYELGYYTDSCTDLFEQVNAVYIATPHRMHYVLAKQALDLGKHVLCEKPLSLKKNEAENLYRIAKKNNLVLYEAIKTAYCLAFSRLIHIAKSGIIGEIKSIEATFTKLIVNKSLREFSSMESGGSVTELASYPLLAIVKLLGCDYKDIQFFSYIDKEKNVDLYTRIDMLYSHAIATAKIGIGVKSEGELVISGTKGYVIVPAPWWKTEYFEIRFENSNQNKKYFYKFDGDGLRYELADFVKSVHGHTENSRLSSEESITIVGIIERFLNSKNQIISI